MIFQSVTQGIGMKNLSAPNRSQTYDILVIIPDASAVSYYHQFKFKIFEHNKSV